MNTQDTQIKDSYGRLCKIFDIQYLQSAELTEEDLHYIFDTSSLIYSLIIAEIRMAGYDVDQASDIEIIHNIISNNEWLNKYYWTHKQFDNFLKILTDIFCNIYQVQYDLAKQRAEMFLINYGLSCVSKNKGSKRVKSKIH